MAPISMTLNGPKPTDHSLTLNISEIAKDATIVTMEGEEKTVPILLNGTIFNDLELPLTNISRSR